MGRIWGCTDMSATSAQTLGLSQNQQKKMSAPKSSSLSSALRPASIHHRHVRIGGRWHRLGTLGGRGRQEPRLLPVEGGDPRLSVVPSTPAQVKWQQAIIAAHHPHRSTVRAPSPDARHGWSKGGRARPRRRHGPPAGRIQLAPCVRLARRVLLLRSSTHAILVRGRAGGPRHPLMLLDHEGVRRLSPSEEREGAPGGDRGFAT